ncbi:MAG TPA: hypothetical protein PKL65_08020 [Bacteroidales bacterium]|nr:hypothetical protein [Bacteroidales bacterium]HNR42161.1 hypothetical protein [Bacteroidales bacterium]
MKKLLLPVLIFLCIINVNSQIAKSVRNINPAAYGGDSQVWDIKSGDGFTFFATGFSLTVWDGVAWLAVSNGRYMRSLDYDSVSKRLYCAGDNMFGYWQQNIYGDFEFILLYENTSSSENQIFWRTICGSDAVYFQTHDLIIRYDPSRKTVSRPVEKREIGYIHKINDVIYVQADNVIYTINDSGIEAAGITVEGRVAGMAKFNDSLIFVSERTGIMCCYNGILSEINKKTNRYLVEQQVFSSVQFDKTRLIVGTVLDGAYLIDRNGNIIEKYNENSGTNFSTVLSIEPDKNKNIWLGLDGGISRIYNTGNESYFRNSRIGNVYACLESDGKLYIGTNKGVYVSENNKPPEFIKNTQGQVWDILKAGNDILVNHDKGLFVLNRNMEQISEPVWRISPWYGYPDIFLVSGKSGFSIYEVKNKRLVFRNKLEGFTGNFPSGRTDKYGNIWVTGLEGCVQKLMIDKNKRKVEKSRFFTFPDPVGWIYTSVLDGELIFNSGNGFYNYDIGNDVIVKNDYYTELFEDLKTESREITQTGNLFFNINVTLGTNVVERISDTTVIVKKIFADINNELIPPTFCRYQKLNDSIVTFGFSNGAAFYNIKQESEPLESEIKLRKADYIHNDKSYKLPVDTDYYSLPYEPVEFQFYFTGLPSVYNIEYSVDGSQWKWFPITEPLKLFYLKPGVHKLKLKCDLLKPVEKTITIDIARPFTSSPGFYALAVLLAIILLISVYHLYDYRLKVVERRLAKQQTEQLEKERIMHENELLAMEVHLRDKKLTSLAMNSVHINNMLEEIKNDIQKIEVNNPEIREKINSVLKRIAGRRMDEENWKVFEKHFNYVHDGFFDRLKTQYGNLSNNDLKICAYIKLRLSTKEIAVLLNITPSSAVIARHRLRRKLNISSDVSLSDLIGKI